MPVVVKILSHTPKLQDDNASSGGALVDFSAPTALTTRSLNKLNLQQSEQQSRSKNTMSSKWTSYAESGVEARNEEKRKRPGKAFAAYEIDEADDEGEEEKEDEDEDEEDATASQANSKGSWANSKISSEYRDMVIEDLRSIEHCKLTTLYSRIQMRVLLSCTGKRKRDTDPSIMARRRR